MLSKSDESSARTWPRGLRFGMILALAAMGAVVVGMLLSHRSQIEALSKGSAYAALVLMALTLVLGPINILRSSINPVSSQLRRDIGILAALFSLAHVGFGLQVHFNGDMMRYFFNVTTEPGLLRPRVDAFGMANHLGAVAAFILLGLLAISNNASIRALRLPKWKGYQRMNYTAAVLVAIHGIVYQVLERRTVLPRLVLIGIALAVLIAQVAGYRRRRMNS